MRDMAVTIARVPALAITLAVRGYQAVLSPLLVGHCKFVPSCSEYCVQAVREWGALRGAWLGCRRVLRCHPFGMGGLDPVPRRGDGPQGGGGRGYPPADTR